MSARLFIRAGAVALVALAVGAAVIEVARDDGPPSAPPAGPADDDPLRRTLLRCRDLGAAATADALCRSAWAESRHRFLGPSRIPEEPAAAFLPRPAATPGKEQDRLPPRLPAGAH